MKNMAKFVLLIRRFVTTVIGIIHTVEASKAIRTIATLVAERIIALDGRKIKLIDEERLRKISKMG